MPTSFASCIARILIVSLIFSSSVLSFGCASRDVEKYGPRIVQVDKYPECYREIGLLRQSEASVVKTSILGAVLGALAGAVIGVTAGKKDGKSAALGAIAGVLVGATAGYKIGESQKKVEDDRLRAQYVAQLDEDIQTISREVGAAKVARNCYDAQFKVALAQFKKGEIGKEEFAARYKEISDGLTEAAQILGKVGSATEIIAKEYREAVEKRADVLEIPKTALHSQKGRTQKGRTGKKVDRATKKKLDTDDGKQLTKMAAQADSLDQSNTNIKEEEKRLQERLLAHRQLAEDAMS